MYVEMTTRKDFTGIEITTNSRVIEVKVIKITVTEDKNQQITEDQITNARYKVGNLESLLKETRQQRKK